MAKTVIENMSHFRKKTCIFIHELKAFYLRLGENKVPGFLLYKNQDGAYMVCHNLPKI